MDEISVTNEMWAHQLSATPTYARAPQGRGDEHHPQRLARQLVESGELDDLGVDERELDKELQRRPYTNDGENLD